MMGFTTLHRHMETMHRLHSYAARAGDTNDVASSLDRLTITLSREAGVPVEAIAQAVAARLGWTVYDHELLERIAETMHCSVCGVSWCGVSWCGRCRCWTWPSRVIPMVSSVSGAASPTIHAPRADTIFGH